MLLMEIKAKRSVRPFETLAMLVPQGERVG